MNSFRFASLLTVTTLLAACNHSDPTQPAETVALTAEVNAGDPTTLTFDATKGLPAEPFQVPKAVGPAASRDRRPGAPFPDSLRLTDAQKASIQALRTAFENGNTVDLAALKAISDSARAAVQAHKTRDEVRAILAAEQPIRQRIQTKFDQLQRDIEAVLTAAQKAWIAAHRPTAPPPPHS